MKKSVYLALLVVLFGVNLSEGGVSVVMNGSFEDDNWTGPQDIIVLCPKGWPEIYVPQNTSGYYTKFGGYVGRAWKEHGDHSLTLYSKSTGTFVEGDNAFLCQDVYLDDVNSIDFTVNLTTDYPADCNWSNHEFSVFIGIDGIVVWDSLNELPAGGNGEYAGRVDNIEISDGQPHVLAIGMISNNTTSYPYYITYLASVDFVRFDTHCGGFGYLAGDLDRNCYVDFTDYAMLADKWLGDANELGGYGMPDEGVVDEYSLAIIAEEWLACTNSNDANCVCAPLCYEDVTGDGVVDGLDMAALCEQWLLEEPNDLSCDFNYDGFVDAADYAAMANKWRQKNWMYGLE
jgi:hypothetical protein